MSASMSGGDKKPASIMNDNKMDNREVPRDSKLYTLFIADHSGTGGSFNVHNETLLRNSPMIAAWMTGKPNMDGFALSNTTVNAVAFLILWIYDPSRTPTLQDVIAAWPEFATNMANQPLLLPGSSEHEYLDFVARAQAYGLANRYIFPIVKEEIAESVYRYVHQQLTVGTNKGKDALLTVFANTHPDDEMLRSRLVAFCASIKPVLDASPHGEAIIAVINTYTPWTWKTCLSAIEMLGNPVAAEPPAGNLLQSSAPANDQNSSSKDACDTDDAHVDKRKRSG